LGVSDKDAGALPADQAIGDEEAAAPLEEEGAASPPDADGGNDGNQRRTKEPSFFISVLYELIELVEQAHVRK
jgi:hypothetical protein